MKTLLFRLLPFAVCCIAVAEDAPRTSTLQIGQLPGQKIPDLLNLKERNPFTRRETKSAEVAVDKESEENQLRALFQAMPVTGVIRGSGGVKVLLDNLILKEGCPIPALIEGQTEHLVVGKITDTQIEIHFIEAEERAEPRKILISIDIKPFVTVRTSAVPKKSSGKIKATPLSSIRADN